MPAAARLPVIVGVGELADRPAEPFAGRSPLELMAAALGLAEADAGARLLLDLGSLAVMHAASWPVARPAARLAARLGVAPARLLDAPVGGHQPLAALQAAADAIAAGQVEVAAVVGAEAEHTAAAARRAGRPAPWMTEPPLAAPRAADAQPAFARALGLDRPVRAYALYENALPAARGATPAAEQAASARLWASCAGVAARRPAAWLRDAPGADRIARADAGNRRVAWPYSKLMTANPVVNQGAAVLLASLARARAAGLSEDRLVHLHGAAAAREPDSLPARDGYGRSVAQGAVLRAARALAGGRAFDLLELYSCFPCVPKLALDCLGLPAGTPCTVTGGLTFFGAPLNGYMIHATVAMVQGLRAAPGALGLLYGQGGWLTAHRALLLSAAPAGPAPTLDLQDEVRRGYGRVPPLDQARRGAARLETFTLFHGRDGGVEQGLAVCRAGGARLLARVADPASLAALAQFERSPVGDAGSLRDAADGQPEWVHDLAA
jgi:acetyl-CoA C-acetyltransferase